MCALVYTGAKHVFEVLGVCALQDLLEAGNSSHPKNLDEKVFNEKKKKKQISAHTHTGCALGQDNTHIVIKLPLQRPHT